MSTGVLVSILLATYNGSGFLRDQLDSILKQSHSNLEIIICDDASTDSTWEILMSYAEADERIRLFRNHDNIGYNKNFASMVSKASGEYIAFSDQDDIWHVEKIKGADIS
jgi:glycosyltransferase involved in cell wall biosynthesis